MPPLGANRKVTYRLCVNAVRRSLGNLKKTRKMQRELGELQFEPEARDPESLLWVIAQKREKNIVARLY